jgi:imidazolonepropionase-like amidohydrolase
MKTPMRHLIATALILAAVPAALAEEIVVKAAKVYTAAGEPLAPGEVRVKNGKIIEVAKKVKVPEGAKVVDLSSGVLMPGLVDAHTSIGLDGGISESTLEITPNFRVLDAIDFNSRAFRQARADGVTTVAIVPGTDNVIAGLSAVVKTAGDRKSRVVKNDHSLVITLASDPGNGNNSRARPDSIYNRQPTNRMGVVWILREEFARAKAEPDSVLGKALASKLPVVCVSRTDVDIGAALRLKREYPMVLTLAGGHEAYKLKAELAAAKVPVLLAPLTSTPGTGPEGTETILNLAGTLHDADVAVALTGGKLLEQARLAVRFGLPKDAAIAAITSMPANILGLYQRLGVIAEGRDADLVALSGDPFDLTTTIQWTMIDGVIRAEETK